MAGSTMRPVLPFAIDADGSPGAPPRQKWAKPSTKGGATDPSFPGSTAHASIGKTGLPASRPVESSAPYRASDLTQDKTRLPGYTSGPRPTRAHEAPMPRALQASAQASTPTPRALQASALPAPMRLPEPRLVEDPDKRRYESAPTLAFPRSLIHWQVPDEAETTPKAPAIHSGPVRRPSPPIVLLDLQQLVPSRLEAVLGLIVVAMGLFMLGWLAARQWPADLRPAVEAMLEDSVRVQDEPVSATGLEAAPAQPASGLQAAE